MYAKVYVIDVPIRSIAGTHSITEEDLGLAPGTLPPEELATLGSLIVVDKKLLAPIEKLRARTKRLLQSKGVKVGMGTVVTAADFQPMVDTLEEIKAEFYLAKASLVASFDSELARRVSDHPKYGDLIKRYAPDVRRIEKRLSFDIDVYKFDVPQNDPNHNLLSKTLSRSGNDISRRLVREIAEAVETAHKGSIQKSGKLVKQNLGPLRDHLLPKIKSFQLLDSSLAGVAKHLESFINDASAAIDAQPLGHAFLDGSDLIPFETRLNQLRSVSAIESLIASRPAPADIPSAKPVQPSSVPEGPDETPAVRRLPKRPGTEPAPDEGRRRVVAF